VVAVDVDPVAVEVAVETARGNGVAVEALRADVLVDELRPVDVVVANIELGVVEELLARIDARTAVTSGYLASERPRAPGWRPAGRIEVEGWAADVLARPQ
jgi:ribosomal protein L11 methylase PrmA